jgi:pyruvate dehydrogenase kinase 2/3/4
VVETHGVDCENYPPVKVIVAEGTEDITIKISDEGGGIARSALPLIWTFMYTTAAPESVDQDFQGTDFKAPMAGFGYGLPIARLYAQCESSEACAKGAAGTPGADFADRWVAQTSAGT